MKFPFIVLIVSDKSPNDNNMSWWESDLIGTIGEIFGIYDKFTIKGKSYTRYSIRFFDNKIMQYQHRLCLEQHFTPLNNITLLEYTQKRGGICV